MTHAPLPWANNGGRIEGPGAYTSDAVVIGVVGEVNNQTVQNTANARFIVQACNAHEDLLGALAALEALVEWESRMGGWDASCWEQARAAIVKAKQN